MDLKHKLMKSKNNIPKKCLACGSKKLKYVEDVYTGVENINTPDEKSVYDDALECLDCGATNTLDGLSHISHYPIGTDYSKVRNPTDEENENWVKASKTGDLRYNT